MQRSDQEFVAKLLQERLNSLTELFLTLKHVHWNVIGPQFIAVHEMLDEQASSVLSMVDAVAERITALDFDPIGTPGALVESRQWDDYSLVRADALEHIEALKVVYERVIEEHRSVVAKVGSVDLVTQDMLLSQLQELEKFHWFMRAHLG